MMSRMCRIVSFVQNNPTKMMGDRFARQVFPWSNKSWRIGVPWLLFLVAVVWPGGVTGSVSYIASVGGNKGTNVVDVSATTSDVTISVELSQVSVESVGEGSDLCRIRAKGLGLLGLPNGPDLPGFHRLLAIPPNADVELAYAIGEADEIHDISVAQIPGRDSAGDPTPIPATTSANVPVVELGPAFQWRGLRVVPIWIRPVDYDPHGHVVSIMSSVEVTVTMVGQTVGQMSATYFDKNEFLFEDVVANFDLLRDSGNLIPVSQEYPSNSDGEPGPESEYCGDYLIVSANSFVQSAPMMDLVSHLTIDRGFDVVVWDVREIVGSPVEYGQYQQQELLRNKIGKCSPLPDYMLLVGDPDGSNDPGADFQLLTGLSNGIHTDNYFCRVDSLTYDHFLPDITCGRFPAGNMFEFSTIVEKTIAYANGPKPAERRATLVVDSYYQIKMESVWMRLMNFGYMTDRLFETWGNCTAENLVNAINDGRMVVDYCGHGGDLQWVSPGFNVLDVEELENGPGQPFVFATACLTGRVHYGDCMADFWLENPVGGGRWLPWRLMQCGQQFNDAEIPIQRHPRERAFQIRSSC